MEGVCGRESLGTARQLLIRQRINNNVRHFITYSFYTDTYCLKQITRKSYTLGLVCSLGRFNIPVNTQHQTPLLSTEVKQTSFRSQEQADDKELKLPGTEKGFWKIKFVGFEIGWELQMGALMWQRIWAEITLTPIVQGTEKSWDKLLPLKMPLKSFQKHSSKSLALFIHVCLLLITLICRI